VNVEAQRDDPASTLTLVRELIRVRRSLPEEFQLLEAAEGVLAYARGDHVVCLNTTPEPLPAVRAREVVIETTPGAIETDLIAAHAGAVTVG
jgi:alpha-glucosidase